MAMTSRKTVDGHDQERGSRWRSPGETETVDGCGKPKSKPILITKRKQMALTKSERGTIDAYDQERETVGGHDQERDSRWPWPGERETVNGHGQRKREQMLMTMREQMATTKREQMAMTKSERKTVDGHDQERERQSMVLTR